MTSQTCDLPAAAMVTAFVWFLCVTLKGSMGTKALPWSAARHGYQFRVNAVGKRRGERFVVYGAGAVLLCRPDRVNDVFHLLLWAWHDAKSLSCGFACFSVGEYCVEKDKYLALAASTAADQVYAAAPVRVLYVCSIERTCKVKMLSDAACRVGDAHALFLENIVSKTAMLLFLMWSCSKVALVGIILYSGITT